MKKRKLQYEDNTIRIEKNRDDSTENKERLITILGWTQAEVRIFSTFIEGLRQPGSDRKQSENQPSFYSNQ